MPDFFLYLVLLYYAYLLVLLSVNARARHLQERNRHREALDLRRRTRWLSPPRSQMRVLAHLQAAVAAHHAALPTDALDEARKAFDEARTDTHRAIALAVQSMSLRAMGEADAAYTAAQEAVARSAKIKSGPVKAECLLVLAEREREAGNFAHALVLANDMLELSSPTASMTGMAHLMRGTIFRSMGCDDDAEHAFEVALGQAYPSGYWADRSRAAARLCLATLAARQGRGEDGLEHLRQIGPTFHGDARVEVLQAALRVWLQASLPTPGNVLSAAHAALAQLDTIADDVQYTGICRACIGMGLLRAGNPGEALAQLGRAVQSGLGPADLSRVLLDLHDAYRQLNRTADANEMLHRIIALGVDTEPTRQARALLEAPVTPRVTVATVAETEPEVLTLRR